MVCRSSYGVLGRSRGQVRTGKTRQEAEIQGESRVGSGEEIQLRVISRYKDFFFKSKHESDFTLLPGDPEGPFMANMASPVYFNSIREKTDLLTEDGEKVVYLLNCLCQEQSPLKLRDLEASFFF